MLGVYEPVVWVAGAVVAITSLAAERQLSSPQRRGFAFHRACFAERSRAEEERRPDAPDTMLAS